MVTCGTAQAAAIGAGAGELSAAKLGVPRISISPPLLLASLLIWLLASLFSLLLLSDAGVDPSADSSARGFGGAVQRGISHVTPVNVLRVKPPLFHLRHGLPERSNARKPALMAPWLALGPSLWAAREPRPPSIVPSSLSA